MKAIIDSFAGGGGASTGIEMALGRSPDVAINHDPVAIAMHTVNHPDTLHLTNDIWGIDPMSVLPGQPIGLLWASPDCKHFSKAKGKAPRSRNIRDLAWVVVDWAEKRKPDVILLENVEEFKTWGPVDNDGEPIKAFEGQTFDDWIKRLRKAGYKVEWRELRACDYGAPTIRKRLFVVARRDGAPVWPKPTHGDPKSDAVKSGKLKPWRSAAEIIDWTLPCPSIFDTSPEIMAKHGLRAVRPLADATLARVARGLKRYVLDAKEPFLVSVAHGDSGGRREYPLLEPYHTVTSNGVQHALIEPFLSYAQHGGANRSVEDPHHTVTANKKDQNLVVAPTLVQSGYGERDGQMPRALDIEKPLGTVVAGGVKHAVVAPHLMTMRNGGKPFNGADEPAHTITAGGAHLHVVAGYLAQHNLGVTGHEATEPVSTITRTGSQQSVVGAVLTRQFGTGASHSPSEPLRTVMADGAGGKTQLSTAFFAKYYGTGDGATMDEPTHTVTTKDRFGLVEAAIAAPPFTEDMAERARAVADFLRGQGFWDAREFVTLEIAGVTFIIADIGMRMLTPRELFNAQGFPPDYKIDRDLDGNLFSKSDQIGRAGNSVCPPLAAALAGANCQNLIRQEQAA